MAPEEISPEVEQVTDMFVETFNLLRDMERRYPQGRKALDKARTALTVFGDMVVKDVDKRAERKEMEREKEQRRVAAEERQRVARKFVDMHDALREDEVDASQAEQVPPPNAVKTVISTESMPSEPTVSAPRTMQQDDRGVSCLRLQPRSRFPKARWPVRNDLGQLYQIGTFRSSGNPSRTLWSGGYSS
jgi:hypothetical protein